MTRRLAWRTLGACAAVLVFMLFGELWPATDPLLPAVSDEAAPAPPPPAPPAPRTIPQWADVALLRPLFDPARKGEPAASGVPPADVLPRLAGVLLAGHEKRAIFQPDGDRKALVVSEGDQLAGWTIRSITESTVTVVRAGSTRALQPKLDGKPKSPQSARGGP